MNNSIPLSNEATPSKIPWLLIGVVLLLFVAGIVVYFLVQKESHPWYASRISWMEYLFGPGAAKETAAATEIGTQDTTSPLSQLKTQTNSIPTKPGETWCFLGEDNTGRWCVKVPMPSLCEPSRSYGGRDPCEMTLAQQLPLGLVGNNDKVSPGTPRPASSALTAQRKKNARDTYKASLSTTKVV
jgi:hypothetical protein